MENNKTNQKMPKISFPVISQNVFFGGSVQQFPFRQLGPENAHSQNTVKIGGSAHQFLKNSYASRFGHILDKEKQNPEIPVIIFLPFFFSFNNKKQKSLKPLLL